MEKSAKKILANGGDGTGGGDDDNKNGKKKEKANIATLFHFQNGWQYHKIQEIITNKSN